MTPEQRQAAFRALAADLAGVDEAVYAAAGADPCEPIVGKGDPDSPLAFFGRDPGREEVRHGMSFIGAGGQQIRTGLYRHLYGAECPDFAASAAVGGEVFWANTVPYKPVGNKAWSMKVKRRFRDLMAGVLIHEWRGTQVVTLGREAFLWFGIGAARPERDRLEAFWSRADRFVANLTVRLDDGAGAGRDMRLYPLPHPSPLNAVWYRRFPELLAGRLRELAPRAKKKRER